MAAFIKTTEDRFWEKVDRAGEDECWNWIAACTKNGYPQFRYKGVNGYGHRYSFELHKGPIANGLNVGNTCGNRACVNPAHLFLGTDREVTVLKPISRAPSAIAYRRETCEKGHVYDANNLKHYVNPAGDKIRVCLICERDRSVRSNQSVMADHLRHALLRQRSREDWRNAVLAEFLKSGQCCFAHSSNAGRGARKYCKKPSVTVVDGRPLCSEHSTSPSPVLGGSMGTVPRPAA